MVAVDGVECDPLPVLSGVPQGSVLGPFLYINDLPAAVEDNMANLNLFADDVLLYRIITCIADYLLLQEIIYHIEQWSTENFLSFNSSKCKYMVVSRKKNPLIPDIPLQLFGSALERVDSYRYLGVLLTSDSLGSCKLNQFVRKLGIFWAYSIGDFMNKHHRNH